MMGTITNETAIKASDRTTARTAGNNNIWIYGGIISV